MQDEAAQLSDIKPSTDQEFDRRIEDMTRHAEDFRMEKMRAYSARTMAALIGGMTALVAGAGGFGWFFLMEGNLFKALACILGAAIIPLTLQYWAGGPIRAYRREFKSRFMPHFAQALGGLRFFAQKGIAEPIVRKSGIVPPFDHYAAEDCFMGKTGPVKLIMSEARLSKGGQSVFEGTTILTANPALRQVLQQSFKPCPLANPEYSARLSVWTNAPLPAPIAANEKLLKEFYEMSHEFEDSPLSAVFWNKRYIFVAIPHEGNMFECSNLFVPITTSSTAKQCRREVAQLHSIIDVVKLYKTP
ncbi:MAG TPA: DUF3137 domain-containing protein [Alphaproteobacteria bacterium]|nr:DUF3137 domain-containing protein [Alphaproteobacteria bacterium]